LSDKPLTIDEKNEVNFQLFRDSLDSIKHVDLFSVFKKLEDADNKAIIYPVVLLYSKYFVFYLLSYTFISSI
jgi:iron uptake system EfeUOB component EfeO/EfeM